MASFSSIGVGLGGGVDVNKLIQSSVDAALMPKQALQTEAATVQAKISAFGQLKSLVSAFSDAAGKLTSVTGWNGVTAASSNTTAITVAATGGAAATSFSVEVQGLAKAQTSMSAPLLPTGSPVGAGSLRLELGKWSDPATFTRGTAAAVDIAVSATDKLSDIAGKINGANAGVTATILSDASGERLLLRSKGTGEEAGFRLGVTDADGTHIDNTGLSRLVAGATVDYGVNAKATVNGVAVTSSTNAFTNVAGVTFTALQTTTAAVDVTVSKDNSPVRKNLDDFVKTYNALNQALNQITKYDKDNKAAGLLQGDSAAVSLQNTLRGALQSLSSSGTPALRNLADIGVVSVGGLGQVNPTGDLMIDSKKFDKAMENPDAVRAMVRGTDGGNVADGSAGKIKAVTDKLLATDGYFASKDKVFQSALKRNSKDVRLVEDRASRLETSLKARYTALDGQMSKLNALNAYIAQQVTTWNKA